MVAKRKRESYATPVSNEPEGIPSPPGATQGIDVDAPAPFTIQSLRFAGPKTKKRRSSGKRKRAITTDDRTEDQVEKDPSRDQKFVSYTVLPTSHWSSLKKYRRFVVGDEDFGIYDFVYVNHASAGDQGREHAERDHWIAKVLEIRALDSKNVYLRVYWMYWPSELPTGRENYHGDQELVASNHMDIIDAATVSAKALVQHLIENDEAPIITGLYWRQTFDYISRKTSNLKKGCICKGFHNPDQLLLRCVAPACSKWMHEPCLLNAAAEKSWERITQPDDFPKLGHFDEKDNPVPDDTIQVASTKSNKGEETLLMESSTIANNSLASSRSKKGGKAKSRKQAEDGEKPWEGKLHVTLEKKPSEEDEGNTEETVEATGRVVITDLRTKEADTWTEELECLFCHKSLVEE